MRMGNSKQGINNVGPYSHLKACKTFSSCQGCCKPCKFHGNIVVLLPSMEYFRVIQGL